MSRGMPGRRPPRRLEQIEAGIQVVEKEIVAMLREVTA